MPHFPPLQLERLEDRTAPAVLGTVAQVTAILSPTAQVALVAPPPPVAAPSGAFVTGLMGPGSTPAPPPITSTVPIISSSLGSLMLPISPPVNP